MKYGINKQVFKVKACPTATSKVAILNKSERTGNFFFKIPTIGNSFYVILAEQEIFKRSLSVVTISHKLKTFLFNKNYQI